MTLRSVFLASVVFLSTSARAFGADSPRSETQFWPEVDAYVGIDEHARLFFQYSATRQKQLTDYSDGQVGFFLDSYVLPVFRYKLREHPDRARSKLLMFRVGYNYSYNPPTGKKKAVTDNTPTILSDARFPLFAGLLLTERNRFDLRIANDKFQPRYRNRVRLERSFKTGRFILTPYADTEVYYDWRYNKWNQVRYEGGLEWAVTHLFTIEPYYTRQRTTTSTPEYVNATGLKALFYFNNKK